MRTGGIRRSKEGEEEVNGLIQRGYTPSFVVLLIHCYVKFDDQNTILNFRDFWGGNVAWGETFQAPLCMKPWYCMLYLTVSLVVQPVPINRLSSNSWSIQVTNPAGGGEGGGGGREEGEGEGRRG